MLPGFELLAIVVDINKTVVVVVVELNLSRNAASALDFMFSLSPVGSPGWMCPE